jgi:hypothetical protein
MSKKPEPLTSAAPATRAVSPTIPVAPVVQTQPKPAESRKAEIQQVPITQVPGRQSQIKQAATEVKLTPTRTLPSEEAIRVGAYLRWDAAGRPGGDGVRFWLEAEQALLAGELSAAGKGL